jgi:hypothetical protein
MWSGGITSRNWRGAEQENAAMTDETDNLADLLDAAYKKHEEMKAELRTGKVTVAQVADAAARLKQFRRAYNEKANDTAERVVAPEIAAATPEGDSPWHAALRQHALIIKPPCFVTPGDKTIWSTKSFDVAFGPLTGNKDASKVAIKSKLIKRYKGLSYQPRGADEADGNFNMWVGQKIAPLDGEPKLFLSHVQYLIPDPQQREYFLDWLAWVIQHPARKLMFAALLYGKQGTGKSWFCDLMKVIVGRHNVSEPSHPQVCSEFTGWIAKRQFITIHELRKKGRYDIADVLQVLITQKTVSLNMKNIEAFEIENFANFLLITNTATAIPQEASERRYLVIRCVDETRFGDNHGQPTDRTSRYYKNLFGSIGTPETPGDEARRVLWWLSKRTIKLDGESFAPETAARIEMVEATREPLEAYLGDALRERMPPFCSSVVNVTDIVDALPTSIPSRYHNEASVRSTLRSLGCRPIEVGKVRTASGRKRLWALSRQKATWLAQKNVKELAAIYDRGRVRASEFREGEDADMDSCA